MKVGFGCDHASVGLKHILMEHVRNKGYECVDYGTTDPKVPVDYPEFGLKVAEAIKSKEVEKGILICGSGIGISLAANKVPGIRAVNRAPQNWLLSTVISISFLWGYVL